jgi:hypothetical protein
MAEEVQTAQSDATSKRNKKINRLSVEELEKKIEELEKTNQTKTVYYKHLLLRKQELQSSQ